MQTVYEEKNGKKEKAVNEKAKEIKVTVLEGTMDTPAGSIVKFTSDLKPVVIYKIPADRVIDRSNTQNIDQEFTQHMNSRGIYFILFDKDGYANYVAEKNKDKSTDCVSDNNEPEVNFTGAIYIGQVEQNNFLGRFGDKDDKKKIKHCTEVFILTSPIDEFEAKWIDYLEYEFINAIDENKDYHLVNKIGGHEKALRTELKEKLDDIIDFTKNIFSISNYDIFKSNYEVTSADSSTNGDLSVITSADDIYNRKYILRSKDDDGVDAVGIYESNKRFVLCAKSKLKMESNAVLPVTTKSLREEKENSGVIENGILKEDIAFTSLSAAAAFVLLRRVSGLDYWKTEDGVSINEMRDKLASR